MFHVS
jgi:hypothetical protein